MPNDQTRKNYSALNVQDVAELLGVSDRGVRKWIKEKGLPAKSDPRGFTLDWPTTLEWFVAYRNAEIAGTAGTRRPGNGPDGSADPDESYEEALARKTIAEADLKELQLARERSQVAAVADVEKVLTSANKSIQTLLLALPAALASQLIGMTDRAKIFAAIDRQVRSMLSNLANIDAIREARSAAPDEDEAE
jgi:phage terminase Nu1 subunit (DNA packaging protein)